MITAPHQTKIVPALESSALHPSPTVVLAATPRLRCGAELVRASAAFEGECRFTTWRLLLETLLVLGGLLALAALAPDWPVQVLAGLLAGLVQVRLFIFYHDAVHGALFRGSPLGQGLMSLIGISFCSVRSVWRESHDFHHQHNGKLVGSSVGSYPLLTATAVARLPPGRRLLYRISRHPLTIACGYLTTVLVGMALLPFLRDPRRHWLAPVAVALHLAAIALVAWLADPLTALCVVVLPNVVSMAIGAYLFFAQHNFPAMALSPGAWSYTDAALRGSSYFEMGPLMRWCTGSIGYHHVHHLNHRIPFYRLREAMAAMPELQTPGRTSWRIRDIRACLRLHAWDAEAGRLVSLDRDGRGG